MYLTGIYLYYMYLAGIYMYLAGIRILLQGYYMYLAWIRILHGYESCRDTNLLYRIDMNFKAVSIPTFTEQRSHLEE